MTHRRPAPIPPHQRANYQRHTPTDSAILFVRLPSNRFQGIAQGIANLLVRQPTAEKEMES
jgi:hypothetical protein